MGISVKVELPAVTSPLSQSLIIARQYLSMVSG